MVALISILALIGIIIAITIYIYENSAYYKMTNYSYIKLWTDRKVKNTYKLSNALSNINGDHKLLFDVKIPMNNEQTCIDAIIFHESGLYILNSYHMNGWIYGREQDEKWAQALHKEQLKTFDNPIIQNKKVISRLREMLPNIDDTLFYTLVVFNDGCSFKKIETHSLDVDVMKKNELKQYWAEPIGVNLSKEQIEACYTQLEKYTDISTNDKNSQINSATAK